MTLRPIARAFVVGYLLALSSACGPSVAHLANTFATPMELATAVLSALEARDLARLRALAVSNTEFRDHVWPELPAARPERNMPLSYVWEDLNQKSEASLGRTLAQYGGQRFTLSSVQYLGATTPYRSYLVHRRTQVTVRDAVGNLRNLRLFGSVLEKDGRVKVFSYVVDDD